MTAIMQNQSGEAEHHARVAVEASTAVQSQLPTAIAVLAWSMLSQQHIPEALEHARQAAEMLHVLGRVDDADGEALIGLVLAESLAASDDMPGAKDALLLAHQRLEARAAAIEEPAWRESFRTRIPQHARITALAQQWGIAPKV